MIPPRILAGSKMRSLFRTALRFRNPFLDFRSLGYRLSCVTEIGAWPGSGTPLASSG